MKNLTTLSLPIAAAALICTSTATLSADSAKWGVAVENGLAVASTFFENGLNIGITFTTGTNCNTAFLFVNNPNITDIAASIDGKVYAGGMEHLTHIGDFTALPMTKEFLMEIKNGHSATIATDQGTVRASLKGSSKAILGALSACIAQAESAPRDSGRQLAPATATGQSPAPIKRSEVKAGRVAL